MSCLVRYMYTCLCDYSNEWIRCDDFYILSTERWAFEKPEEVLEKVNSAYQEMYYDIHQESLIRKQSCTN
jgi:hypothetical protein